MKKLMKYNKILIIIVFAMTVFSCAKDIFVEPEAKFRIAKSNITVLEKMEVENLGKGEYFSFWPGDKGHNYNLRSMGGNIGLAPNSGIDFEYYYLKAGIYTVVMVASSYDSEEDKYIQKVDSFSVTVAGVALNFFTSFGIFHAWASYSPQGRISNDSISINIAPVNRPIYKDSLFAYIINGRPPLFTVAGDNDDISVYDENNTLLNGDGTDQIKMNVFEIIDPNTVEPIIKTFKVVDNNSQKVHAYKVAAMLYPQLNSYSVEGDTALMFSLDGLSKPTSDQISAYLTARPDSIFVGVFLLRGQELSSVTPTFSVTPGSIVTLNGIEQISGVSKVDFTKQPIVYKITRNYSGFEITSKFAVNYLVF
jgi:hypothetical protein